MSDFDLEALKREYVASDERGDTKFTIDFYDMTIVLERLEQAEQGRVKLRNRLDAMRRQRDGYRAQARKAEQAVARVREVAAGWATNDRPFREALLRALDGHTKQLGGTPTDELADVCSCGKSYWPCTALDGEPNE